MAAISGRIRVEVAYGLPDEQFLMDVELPAGTTVREAIRRSGVLRRYPAIDLTVNRVGVFGVICTLDRPLYGGERVEIYRPLVADPKEVRRRRAAGGQ